MLSNTYSMTPVDGLNVYGDAPSGPGTFRASRTLRAPRLPDLGDLPDLAALRTLVAVERKSGDRRGRDRLPGQQGRAVDPNFQESVRAVEYGGAEVELDLEQPVIDRPIIPADQWTHGVATCKLIE